MSQERVLVIPGAASPLTDEYAPVYGLIEDEARRRQRDVLTVVFPGQCIRGTLSFASAVRSTARVWEKFVPTWVIARSFGCVVAARLLSDREFAHSVRGAVLWGPTLSCWVKRFLPSQRARRLEVAKYKKHGTNLELRFFDDFAALEILIEGVRADFRLARGGLDKYNSREDLQYLAAIHRRRHPDGVREIVEVASLEHSVTDGGRGHSRRIDAYLKALFSPIGKGACQEQSCYRRDDQA